MDCHVIHHITLLKILLPQLLSFSNKINLTFNPRFPFVKETLRMLNLLIKRMLLFLNRYLVKDDPWVIHCSFIPNVLSGPG